MSKVHILAPEIISKIAAGEVVERPASVVKELIENALDARTENIEVSLKSAGKTYIRVKDKGLGIAPDDIEKIFFRHSTSKISDINDLYAIDSLGFRGEALYSIAAIADVCLRSKIKSSDTGWETHLRGGEQLRLKPVSMPDGTEIEVKELFFNTPARRKFLKSDTGELRQILNIIVPYALLYPRCRFSLTHYDHTLLDLPPQENYIARIAKALHLKSEHILETEKEFSGEDISVRLVLGDINIQRARKDMQFIFVNNRPVHNYVISYHLNQIYKLIFPPQVFPFFAVYITLPAQNVDLNIHPTKREVKIKNEHILNSFLRSLCESALLSYGKAKQVEKILPSLREYSALSETLAQPSPADTALASHRDGIKEPSPEQYLLSDTEQSPLSGERTPVTPTQDNLRNKLAMAQYIGAFLSKYLLFESGVSLLIIDQHAADERITYEQLLRQIEASRIEVQHLLTPLVIQLSMQEKLIWEQLQNKLETVGLSTTLWDNQSIALHTHPQLIKSPEIALRNLLSEEDSTYIDTDILARRVCRSSIMAGDKMVPEQARYLRNQLLNCKDPFTCLHGRPTVIEIGDNIFQKQFLRR